MSVVLEKNPDYHMGEPDVERLIFQVIPDSDTALQAFFNGEVDMLKGVPNSQVPALLQDPQYKLGYSSAARRYQIAVNMQNEKMTWEVRKAVSLAIDREEISLKGTNGLMPPGPTVSIRPTAPGPTMRTLISASAMWKKPVLCWSRPVTPSTATATTLSWRCWCSPAAPMRTAAR